MRLTVDEYSKEFKMSKEMIKSKLKTKVLDYITEDGIVYILTPDKEPEAITPKNEPVIAPAPVLARPKTTVATVLALYQRENKQLKEKILKLEDKIDQLINDKEQMLRDERDKIESLYTTKDEQLKTILELINTKLVLEKEPELIHDVDSISHSESNKEKKKNSSKEGKLVELRDYLKTLSLKSYQRKIIKKRFLAVHNSDVRILQQNGKLYLDLSKYDYSDLLEY